MGPLAASLLTNVQIYSSASFPQTVSVLLFCFVLSLLESPDLVTTHRTYKTYGIETLILNVAGSSVDETEYEYLGCYRDQVEPRLLEGVLLTYPETLTPSLCVGLCKKKGYVYAGVQDRCTLLILLKNCSTYTGFSTVCDEQGRLRPAETLSP